MVETEWPIRKTPAKSTRTNKGQWIGKGRSGPRPSVVQSTLHQASQGQVTFLNCLFVKDFSHKKREPIGSLFLCLVVKGTTANTLYLFDFAINSISGLRQLPPGVAPVLSGFLRTVTDIPFCQSRSANCPRNPLSEYGPFDFKCANLCTALLPTNDYRSSQPSSQLRKRIPTDLLASEPQYIPTAHRYP